MLNGYTQLKSTATLGLVSWPPAAIAWRRVATTVVCLLPLVAFIGCSASTARSPKPQPVVVEVVTVEQQARNEVLSTPTQFFVSLEEDETAWDRALFFLAQYTDGGIRTNKTTPAGAELVSNLSANSPASTLDSFFYVIEKARHDSGFSYRVRGRAKNNTPKDMQALRLNEQNIARFIKSGNLEVSLLNR